MHCCIFYGLFCFQFNWTHFIVGAYNAISILTNYNYEITDNLIVILRTPSYFEKLSDVYAKYNSR